MVSFVLPAWKGRFLREAIRSILSQTFRDLELVVYDDCSPDRSVEDAVRGFSDPRTKYFRGAGNIGGKNLAAAWNEAFARARGEFCVLASDDDVYAPRYLETMMALARAAPGAGVYHCRVAYIDENGAERGLSELRAPYETPAEFFRARAALRLRQHAQEFMFRTADLRKAGGFVEFPRAWYSDDATWMMLARDGGAAYSPEPLFSFRFSGCNITSQYGDAPEKIAAGEAFVKWAADFARTLEPRDARDARDAALLRDALRRLPAAVDAVSLWTLRHAGWRVALRAILSAGGPAARISFAFRMLRAAARGLACRVLRRNAQERR